MCAIAVEDDELRPCGESAQICIGGEVSAGGEKSVGQVLATSILSLAALVARFKYLVESGAFAVASAHEEDEELGGVASLVEVECGRCTVKALGIGIGVVDDLLVGLLCGKCEETEVRQQNQLQYLH